MNIGDTVTVEVVDDVPEDPEQYFQARGYPPALAKACVDNPWQYAVRLRTGEGWLFEGAHPVSDTWVHLERVTPLEQIHVDGAPPLGSPAHQYTMPQEPMIFDRGIDVRLRDIVWVADAPWGS